jgi:hypothetical protein
VNRKTWSTLKLGLLAPLALGAVSRNAEAQIGTGWEQFHPMKSIQLRGAGAKYDDTNGIETFSIAPGDERSEARIHDDHTSGRWQFEGWVNVKPGVEGGCVHQVFKFLMIVAYPNDGGELRQHSYQKLGTTNAYNRWVRINTIHDATARRAEIYIDGVLEGTMTDTASGGPNGWYHKYGIYNSSRTSPVIQWKDVKFFKAAGQPGPISPATDAAVGAPDAGPGAQPDTAPITVVMDASPDRDTAPAGGAGGGSGAGGAGGGSGTPPRPRPDATPPDPVDEPPPGGRPPSAPREAGGMACRVDARPDSQSSVAMLLVGLAIALACRRRRAAGRSHRDM